MKSFFYVEIPKNASNGLKHIWPKDCERVDISDPRLLDSTAVVVVRDPLERWYSGIAQFYYPTKFRLDNFDDMAARAKHEIILDSHTYPQTDFFKNIKCSSVQAFYLNDSLEKNLGKWAEKNNIPLRLNYFKKLNVSQDHDFKREFIKHLKMFLANDAKFMKKWESYYRDDINFVNLVKTSTN